MTDDSPSLVYADARGNILDAPDLEMAGSSAGRWHRLSPEDWIPLPEGSELFLLPRRLPAGYDPARKRFRALEEDPDRAGGPVQAVGAFMAPAHTLTYSPAYEALPRAPLLPLFSYAAVGWREDEGLVAAGFRVDEDERQDFRHMDPERIRRNARRRMSLEGDNRLVRHLGKCALTYGCPAARNLFMERWEAPLPTSPVCNAACLGCISLQKSDRLRAPQDRIAFVPTAEEIVGVAVPHLKQAPRAVASFGQGCEGEPLLQASVLERSIRIMREETSRGTINLNTNGSLPRAVEKLCRAGLDSIRVSLNSCRPSYYSRYFRPKGYRFEDLKETLGCVKAHGRFASVNYFVLPGFTDDPEEFEALCSLIEETDLDLIQMRNLNIDPLWYLRVLRHKPSGAPLGVLRLMKRLQERFPRLRFGYFNPPLDF